MRPNWTQLERVRPGRTERIWAASQDTFLSKVAGPVFERMCRLWAEDMADPQTFGGQPARVLSGVVRDPAARASYEVDLAALDAAGRVLAIGEAKWGKRMDAGHLARLEKIADVLGFRGQRPGVLALSAAPASARS
jgi:hypothetical protein